MIIDGHSHACGKYLTAEGIIKTLNENGIDKVVLVPGEINNKSEYSLPNIASKFSKHNADKLTNQLTTLVIKLTRKLKNIPTDDKELILGKNMKRILNL
jgi:choline kinase